MKRVCLLLTLMLCCLSWLGAEEIPSSSDVAERNKAQLEWREWQHPLSVFPFLGVQPGDDIAALESEDAFFTPLLSFLIGSSGNLYMLGFDQAEFDQWSTLTTQFHDNLYPLGSQPEDAALPQGELDLVLVVNSWYRIKHRKQFLGSLAKSLNPGGRVAIIDFRAGETSRGPSKKQRTSRRDLVKQFEKGGWQLAAESVALADQYFLVFRLTQD
jgi:predicted methyltransferase